MAVTAVRSDDDLAAGLAAAARREWDQARPRLQAVVAREPQPQALLALAGIAGAERALPEMLSCLEAAFRAFLERDDRRTAARAAFGLAAGYALARGEAAVASGWLQRARSLLADLEVGPEHAWLALWEAHIELVVAGQLVSARGRLEEGQALARRLGVRDAVIFGTGLEGMVRIAEGDIVSGLQLLDEAATGAVAGELEDLSAGQACCYVLTACENVLDFERASQWCRRAIEYFEGVREGTSLSFCRGHVAGVLTWRGDWAGAEQELAAHERELADAAPRVRGSVASRRGELRRRQGRWDDAEVLLASAEAWPEAIASRAALALDRGNAEAAVELAERFQRHLPGPRSFQRALVLGTLARAQAARGRHDEAEAALEELRGFAGAAPTLRAEVALVEAILAAAGGDPERARLRSEAAISLYAAAGAPYETALARVTLAEALLAIGRTTLAIEEAGAAERALAELGAAMAQKRAAAVRTRALGGANATNGPLDALTARQRDVLRLVAQGLSNKEIAARLHLSEATVKRHVADILTRLDLSGRAAAAAWATRQELG